MLKAHTFHIPVMGIGFTVDTALRVSPYGIDSVISLVDDMLLEKLRKMYCEKFQLPYQEISDKIEDFRAKRITSYLNLIKALAEKKFEELKIVTQEKSHEIKEYFNLLPDNASLKQELGKLTAVNFDLHKIGQWISDKLSMGSIDVNIMTKLDKENYKNGEKLEIQYNDAFAAVRGFALSELKSSLVLSAGMSPRLYGYMEEFEDFYPDEKGFIKKKIVLKVSDYRSAFIQGRFFAKKGLWVSEYRIESGLNCGGHAFATDGFLMGPILNEFKVKRHELADAIFTILKQSLADKGKVVPEKILPIKITAQGGVGTAEEHQFLLNQYDVDSVGWATPFLLVPEVTNLDEQTRQQLCEAKEKDLYLSNISPLGIPFNSLKGNSKDLIKLSKIAKGRPGSPCPKKYLVSNKEFTEKSICTASRQYQKLKIDLLDQENLDAETYHAEYEKIVDKSCICVGLGTSALLVNNLDTKTEDSGVSVCPGPNMAYFSKIMNLKELVDHIYGRTNVIKRKDRPNMFVKEIDVYIKYLKDKIDEVKQDMTTKQEKYFLTFIENLNQGIQYYTELFNNLKGYFEDEKADIFKKLQLFRQQLQQLSSSLIQAEANS